MLLSLLVACFAAMSCRSPKAASASHSAAPLPPATPAVAATASSHDARSSPGSSRAGALTGPVQASGDVKMLPADKTPPGRQQAAPATATPGPQPADSEPSNGQQAAPAAAKTAAVQAPVALDPQKLSGTALTKPSSAAVTFPNESILPAAESTVAGNTIAIGLWGPLTSSAAGAASIVPPRAPDDPAANAQTANRALSLPPVGGNRAQNGSSGDNGAGAITIMDPLLKNNPDDERRREEEIRRQETELKSRETERDNLNHALYRFLLGN